MFQADNPLLKAALDYAEMGEPVFPVHTVRPDGTCTCSKGAACSDVAKHPRTKHGWKEATTNPKIIKDWWEWWPHANVGVATGVWSDILDLDGITLAEWTRLTGFRIPPSPKVITPGGGEHYHFRPAMGLGNGVKRVKYADTRAKGGYVIMPPSLHRTGRRYEWAVSPTDVPLPEWPADILAALLPPSRPAPSLAPRPDGITVTIPESLIRWAERGAARGQQANAAFWLACRLRQHGADDAEGWRIMETFASACTPPADLTKLGRIWRDSTKYQGYQPFQQLREPVGPNYRVLPQASRPTYAVWPEAGRS